MYFRIHFAIKNERKPGARNEKYSGTLVSSGEFPRQVVLARWVQNKDENKEKEMEGGNLLSQDDDIARAYNLIAR